jgi:hypothetical protein
MNLQIIINQNQISNFRKDSIRINKKNDFSSEATFSVTTNNLSFAEVGQNVSIFIDNNKVFGGIVREIQYTIFDYFNQKFIATVYASDYRPICTRRTINAYYVNTNAGNIVQDLITKFLAEEGITAGTIENGIYISVFNETVISIYDILDKLSNESGYVWYIDDNKALNFIPKSASTMDYYLKDIKYKEINITRTIQDYRNKQFVKYEGNQVVQTISVEDDNEINNRKQVEGGSGVYGNIYEATAISNEADAMALAQNLLNENNQIKNNFSITAKGLYGLGNLIVEGNFAGTYEISEITIYENEGEIWTDLQCIKTADAMQTFANALKGNTKLIGAGSIQSQNYLKNSSFERYTTTNKPLYYDTDGLISNLTNGPSANGVVLGSYQKIENSSLNRPPSSKFNNSIAVLTFYHMGGSVQVQVFNQDTWTAMNLTNGQTYINIPARDKWTIETVGINLVQTSGIWIRITNIDTNNVYIDNIMLSNDGNYVDGPESAPWDNTATPYMVNEYNIQTQTTVNLTFNVPYTAPPYVGVATSTTYSYQLIQDNNGYYTGVQITFGASGLAANIFVIGRL